MKKFLPLFLILALSLVGCKDGGEPHDNQEPVESKIETSCESIILPSKTNDSYILTITTSHAWSIDVSDNKGTPDWLTVNPHSGRAGKSEIVISANQSSQNPEGRTAQLKIKSGTATKTLDIKQLYGVPCTYYVHAMGDLDRMLSQKQKDTITRMQLFGNINAADFATMRDKIPNLAYLDMSEVTVDQNKIPNFAFSLGRKNDNGIYERTHSLRILTLPKSITAIGNHAFALCQLTSLTIPGGVTEIGDSAFYWCSELTGNLIIPGSVITIGDSAFDSCSGLTGNLIIPGSVTTIGDYAFSSCYGFTGDLIIPGSVITIGDGAFSFCMNLTGTLTIPNSVTTIGKGAFANCYRLSGSLTIPTSITVIEDETFFFCGFTGQLIIPNNITSIGAYAFRQSQFSGSLTIPSSVTSIGTHAFGYSHLLNGSLTIPNSITSIADSAFFGCMFTGSLIIPPSVTSIGNGSFRGNKFIGTLNIPSTVTSIGRYAFDMCDKIDKVHVSWIDPIDYNFGMFPSKKTIEVPANALQSYIHLPGWKDQILIGYY